MGWGTGRRWARACALSGAVWLASLLATQARAQTDFNPTDPNAVQVHALVSQGFLKTSSNNYLSYSHRGAFDYTEVAANITKNLTDDIRVGAQLFTRDLGPGGTFIPQFNWYYIDYRFRDWLGIRAGRTKIPFGLYNEGSEADQTRVPVLLPQSVYPIDHQDYLLAQTGGEIYGNVRIGDAGALDYRAYGGTLQVATPASPAAGVTVANLTVPYVYGGRVMWSTPLEGLTLGGTYQALRFDWNYNIEASLAGGLEKIGLLPAMFNGTLPVKFYVKLYVASLEYRSDNLLLAAEYSRWIGDIESGAKLVSVHAVNERYYAMVSYRMAPWFTPGVYYSVYYPDVHQTRHQNYQHDFAVTARYDINRFWLVKLEGHLMDGTAALDPGLNGVANVSTLTKDWGLFLVKTTAYF